MESNIISSAVLSSRFSRVLNQKSIKEFDAKSNESFRPRSGAFGKVTKLDWNGTTCAGKILHTTNYEEDREEEYVKDFHKEISLWQEMSHPHIVQLHGIWIQPKTGLPYMVMELLECSLAEYLQNVASIPLRTKLEILHDVAKGLVYLHEEKKFAHRDLTTSNILLSSNNVAKIGDFGQARLLEGQINQLTKCPGNLSFMPPEALQNPPVYDLSIDTFSYGCVTLHTITKKFPVPLAETVRSNDGNACRTLSEVERREEWINLIDSNNPVKKLIYKCLENNRAKRPRATDILFTIKGKLINMGYGMCN